MLLAAAHLFGPFNNINLYFFLPAGYSSREKYNSPPHFYFPQLMCRKVVTEPGLGHHLPAVEKLELNESFSMSNTPVLLKSCAREVQ
jgi:hypothetical protein